LTRPAHFEHGARLEIGAMLLEEVGEHRGLDGSFEILERDERHRPPFRSVCAFRAWTRQTSETSARSRASRRREISVVARASM
jgi:hypothetical protein